VSTQSDLTLKGFPVIKNNNNNSQLIPGSPTLKNKNTDPWS
jgi:hypothetical protein